MTELLLDQSVVDCINENAEVVVRTDDIERDSWLAARHPYIGGSDASASLGLNPWRSQYALWCEKTGAVPNEIDNEPIRWGHRLEEPIGRGIAEDVGAPIDRWPYLMSSRKYPWAAVNVDFLSGPFGSYPGSIVEVKNVGQRMAHEWDNGAVPAMYGLQGQHACAVLGLPGVHFFALVAGNSGRAVYVERNEGLIENLMEAEQRFWTLVEDNTPPDLDGSASTLAALKAQYFDPMSDSEVDLSDRLTSEGLDVEAVLERRAEAKREVQRYGEIVKECENQLFSWIGNHEIALVNGVVRFSWKKTFRSGYTVEPNSYRKLHVSKIAK